ncbi:hypothetical protein MKZ38_007849 [Zalerion maritima]|uniref:Succinate dehydrogenase [ubiquinone] cytochrome b small subunit n=1 Tax=Zalerion maritima TaxID=339359 RepID=A0AAD5WTI6_9PEZI|nr:hypothetical protein MKZ38_007849 [Zalerion maritima]
MFTLKEAQLQQSTPIPLAIVAALSVPMASIVRPALFRQGVLRPAFKPGIIQTGVRVAAFQTTTRKRVLPPLPLNDPVPVPEPSPSHGSYHWSFERLLAVGLVPLTIAPFAAGSLNPIMDSILCGTLLVHSHLGFQSMIIDYIPTKRLPTIRKLSGWALNAATLLVGVGLYEFETNDVGLTETVKRVWNA